MWSNRWTWCIPLANTFVFSMRVRNPAIVRNVSPYVRKTRLRITVFYEKCKHPTFAAWRQRAAFVLQRYRWTRHSLPVEPKLINTYCHNRGAYVTSPIVIQIQLINPSNEALAYSASLLLKEAHLCVQTWEWWWVQFLSRCLSKRKQSVLTSQDGWGLIREWSKMMSENNIFPPNYFVHWSEQ